MSHRRAGSSLPAKPKAPRGRGLKTLPDYLETVTVHIILAEDELRKADGSTLVPVGHERAEKLDWEPGRFIRKVTVRTRYGTPDTRESLVSTPVATLCWICCEPDHALTRLHCPRRLD